MKAIHTFLDWAMNRGNPLTVNANQLIILNLNGDVQMQNSANDASTPIKIA